MSNCDWKKNVSFFVICLLISEIEFTWKFWISNKLYLLFGWLTFPAVFMLLIIAWYFYFVYGMNIGSESHILEMLFCCFYPLILVQILYNSNGLCRVVEIQFANRKTNRTFLFVLGLCRITLWYNIHLYFIHHHLLSIYTKKKIEVSVCNFKLIPLNWMYIWK